MERSRRRVDGLGAQAREARGVQCYLSGDANGTRSRIVEGDTPWLESDARYVITLDADTHSAARRRGGAHRHDRASAQSRSLSRTAGRRVVRRLRHFAAARECHARECESVALCLDLRGSSRCRSLHHRGLGCLSGPVRRRDRTTGKGIYDVAAFERATDGRFPENALLSHDLIEGSCARAGLVTDVEIFDDFPVALSHGTPRQQRWIARRLAAAAVHLLARDEGDASPRSRAGKCSTTCGGASSQSRCSPGSSRDGPFAWIACGLDHGRARRCSRSGGCWRRCSQPCARRDVQSWRPYYLALGRDADGLPRNRLRWLAIFLPHQAMIAA